jgi:hypothetical protein
MTEFSPMLAEHYLLNIEQAASIVIDRNYSITIKNGDVDYGQPT